MKILFSLGNNNIKDHYAPKHITKQIEELGEVIYNPLDRPFTKDELCKYIKDVDILVTHWAAPKIDKDVLKHANKLKLIAHGAGSVHGLVDESVYDKGIKVVSSNKVMAKYVAETVLTNILAYLQQTFRFNNIMKDGIWKETPKDYIGVKSLYNAKVSFIGFGTVGKFLFELMKPFNIDYMIYDPYLDDDNYENVSDNLDKVMAFGDVVTLHASLTEETINLINKDNLKLIKNGALFVNSARGQIVDQQALISELESKRIHAVLDVYDEEPLPADNKLRYLNNAYTTPHVYGVAARYEFMEAVISDLDNYINNKPLEYEVSKKQWSLMTRWG